MNLSDLRIVFFGTPDFAVASLKALSGAGCNVVGVVTAPDKPAGRGREMQESAVKRAAVEAGVPVLQPLKLKAPEFLGQLGELRPNLQVVVAFRMLPEAVWNAPPLGTINVHASLLPQYRGAAPINWAIIHGETETGVTTFRLRHEIDTGPLLLQSRVPIHPEDNAGTIHDKLMVRGAELLVETVRGLANNSLHETPQPQTTGLKHAPKIFREDLLLDWTQPAEEVHNRIRGLSPYPGAVAQLSGREVKILGSYPKTEAHSSMAGTHETDGKTFLRFAASDGWLYVTEMQPEGKKRMDIAAFLRGWRG
jgi:methionyl-tRNA formyltransferase